MNSFIKKNLLLPSITSLNKNYFEIIAILSLSMFYQAYITASIQSFQTLGGLKVVQCS